MKLTHSMILLLVFISSAFAQAEECTLKIQEYVPEAGCSRDVQEYPSFDAVDWQSCASSAQSLATQIGYESDQTFIAIDKFSCKRSFAGQTKPKRIVKWSYDDSFISFMNSQGVVNSETSKVWLTPQQGNQALDTEGKPLIK